MRFSTTLASFLITSLSVLAAPIPALRENELVARANVLSPTTYATVQISGGTGGNAQAQAAAVCVTPFANVDLASVDKTSLTNLAILRKAAESAETDFNTAIKNAGGPNTVAGAALDVGKTKNKVLKLTCLLQVNKIKQAQGDTSAAAAITDSETKLTKNISIDVANKGKASTPLANSPAAAASEKAKST